MMGFSAFIMGAVGKHTHTHTWTVFCNKSLLHPVLIKTKSNNDHKRNISSNVSNNILNLFSLHFVIRENQEVFSHPWMLIGFNW